MNHYTVTWLARLWDDLMQPVSAADGGGGVRGWQIWGALHPNFATASLKPALDASHIDSFPIHLSRKWTICFLIVLHCVVFANLEMQNFQYYLQGPCQQRSTFVHVGP